MDATTVSGPGRQLAALVPHLAASGVDVKVVLFQRTGRPKPPYADFLADAGIPHVVLRENGRFDATLLGKVSELLDAWAPHIVQTHSYRPTAIAYALRRRGAAWRWVAFFHGTTNENLKVRLYHWIDRKLVRAADRIVVMTCAQADLFGGLGARVRQIHNAVLADPGSARLPDAVARRIEAVGRPRLGVIGRLSHEKGVDIFLDAFRLLADRGIAAGAVIAGDGPERERLAVQAARLGVAGSVHFLGAVHPADPLYPELDLVVIPSRSEGLPNVLLEALSAGRRVVSTDVGAVTEVLEDAAAGRVVPARDPVALADAIAAGLAEPVEAGADARRVAVDRFSIERRRAAHVALYEEVTKRASPRVPELAS